MLLVVCVAASVGVIALAVRWWLTRVDVLGRSRAFPVIGTGLLLAVAVASGVPVVRHARFEERLSAVASHLAGAAVTVRCQTMSQAWTEARPEAGYVRFDADGRPESMATITVETCADLRSWVGSGAGSRAGSGAGADAGDSPVEEVIAVHVLTHEAMHLAGHRDEAGAECAAVQRDARAAALLGAGPDQAVRLARRYWREIYPQLAEAYRSGDCRSGGSLDEHLDGAPWTA